MPTIQKAILMAAGKGTRMSPITDFLPKPLVKVHGKPMIETLIDALRSQGITEIYIVVGYQKELFNPLASKYEEVTLLENPYFDSCNNISSLYVAREYLENSIILDADQIVNTPSILHTEFDQSGYSVCYTSSPTQEWILELDSSCQVLSCSRTGGNCGYQLFSVSRWTQEDGRQLKQDLEEEFEKRKNTQIYWDDVVLFCHPSHYKLKGHIIPSGSIKEIDSLEELAQEDLTYLPLWEAKQKEASL